MATPKSLSGTLRRDHLLVNPQQSTERPAELNLRAVCFCGMQVVLYSMRALGYSFTTGED